MSESERTKRMKYFLKQKFNRNDSDYKLQLQEEVSCGEYHRNRCDLAGIEYVNGKIHNSIGIEIKQQLGDFKSGCGMNFCFDVNYLCVPKEEKLSKETAKVFIQLVNMEESKEMLQHVPHRQFLDLAIIYRIVREETDQGFETGIVNNELMEALDWSEKDLYLKAMSQHIMKTKITLLDDVTCELLLKAGAPREFVDIMYPPEAESHPVYMLTNENMLFGANEILYTENLWKLSNKLHSDLYIIPSSIHECIVLPDDCSIHDVKEMLGAANDIIVSESNQLSYNIYHYERKTGNIKIVEKENR